MVPAGAAGGAIVKRTGNPVRLRNFDHHVRLDIVANDCFATLQLTDKPLTSRVLRPYDQRTALKANVAAAMVRLAELKKSGPLKVGDLFCGSGTILIEAARTYPHHRWVGFDLNKQAVSGAQQNLQANGVTAVEVFRGNSICLAREWDGLFDRIITNPPFGLRLGKRIHYESFYRELVATLDRLLRPGGMAVVLVMKFGVMRHAILRSSLSLQSFHPVEMNGVRPTIMVLSRKEGDAD